MIFGASRKSRPRLRLVACIPSWSGIFGSELPGLGRARRSAEKEKVERASRSGPSCGWLSTRFCMPAGLLNLRCPCRVSYGGPIGVKQLLDVVAHRIAAAVEEKACSDDFVFDNQMLAQAIYFGFRIGEISCPAKYMPEASSIDFRRGVSYGCGVLKTWAQFRLQRMGLVRTKIFWNGRSWRD